MNRTFVHLLSVALVIAFLAGGSLAESGSADELISHLTDGRQGSGHAEEIAASGTDLVFFTPHKHRLTIRHPLYRPCVDRVYVKHPIFRPGIDEVRFFHLSAVSRRPMSGRAQEIMEMKPVISVSSSNIVDRKAPKDAGTTGDKMAGAERRETRCVPQGEGY